MEKMPSTIGDVLILVTRRTFTAYTVGLISEDYQQDFMRHQSNISHPNDIAGALSTARSILVDGRRIFLRNMDTNEWSQIPGWGQA
jgi:hypothetical protein